MAKQNKSSSPQSEKEAYKIALGIQRPEQTKEQTKLIAQGISKGIELYKKQQKVKAREQDKNRKKAQKVREQEQDDNSPADEKQTHSTQQAKLAWTLLIVSWLGFIAFTVLVR